MLCKIVDVLQLNLFGFTESKKIHLLRSLPREQQRNLSKLRPFSEIPRGPLFADVRASVSHSQVRKYLLDGKAQQVYKLGPFVLFQWVSYEYVLGASALSSQWEGSVGWGAGNVCEEQARNLARRDGKGGLQHHRMSGEVILRQRLVLAQPPFPILLWLLM